MFIIMNSHIVRFIKKILSNLNFTIMAHLLCVGDIESRLRFNPIADLSASLGLLQLGIFVSSEIPLSGMMDK